MIFLMSTQNDHAAPVLDDRGILVVGVLFIYDQPAPSVNSPDRGPETNWRLRESCTSSDYRIRWPFLPCDGVAYLERFADVPWLAILGRLVWCAKAFISLLCTCLSLKELILVVETCLSKSFIPVVHIGQRAILGCMTVDG